MIVARVRTRVVDFLLEREFHPAWARGRNQPNLLMVLIEVETDVGVVGYGAAHAGLEAAVRESTGSSLRTSSGATRRRSSSWPR